MPPASLSRWRFVSAGLSYLLVALGGALGAACRHAVNLALVTPVDRLPLSTLAVNGIGALLAGFLAGLVLARPDIGDAWRLLVLTGFMGGFTTFSAFSLDTWRLFEGGNPGIALINILANVVVALSAAGVGLWVGRLLRG